MKLILTIPLDQVKLIPIDPMFVFVVSRGVLKIYKQVTA
jgi:hypothetical protein